MSNEEGDIFYGETSRGGTFTLPLPPGNYWVRVASDEIISSRSVRVSGDAGARVAVALDASMRAPAPDEVVAWVKERAIPISTAEVGTEDQDLAPLVAAFGDARVIGAGEATHGTLEFTQIKHRLFQRMVANHGVTVLAMEANFADAELIDIYLQTGRGTPEDALKHVFRVWQTEEVRDLIAWMRAWNADPKHRRKIHLRGYDVQGSQESMKAVRAYLKRTDAPAEALLNALAPPTYGPHTNRARQTPHGERTQRRGLHLFSEWILRPGRFPSRQRAVRIHHRTGCHSIAFTNGTARSPRSGRSAVTSTERSAVNFGDPRVRSWSAAMSPWNCRGAALGAVSTKSRRSV